MLYTLRVERGEDAFDFEYRERGREVWKVHARRFCALASGGHVGGPQERTVGSRATHLNTGDVKHFGAHFEKNLLGVLVLPPAAYLRSGSR